MNRTSSRGLGVIAITVGVALVQAVAAPSTNPPPRQAAALPASLSGPEFQALRDSYLKQKRPLDGVRVQRLKNLLEKNLAEARRMLKEKEGVQNVKGMAVARNAISIFQSCLDSLDTERTCDLPKDVRHELSAIMDECRTGQAKIDADYSNQVAQIQEEYLPRFLALVARKSPAGVGSAEPDKQRMDFLALMSAEGLQTPPASLPEPAATNKSTGGTCPPLSLNPPPTRRRRRRFSRRRHRPPS